jgi:hypothetical protein
MRLTILTAVACALAAPASGLVLHPDDDPGVPEAQRPSDDVMPGLSPPDANYQWSCVVANPNYIITAAHYDPIPVGWRVRLSDSTYYVLEQTELANADIQVLRIGTQEGQPADMTDWIEPYDGHDELGQVHVMGGRGLGRGSDILGGPNDDIVCGYEGQGYSIRWGQNALDDRKKTGSMDLCADFDGYGDNGAVVDYEAALVHVDSGGGWFIQDEGDWRVAGLSQWVGMSAYHAYFRDVETGEPAPEEMGAEWISPFVEDIIAAAEQMAADEADPGAWAWQTKTTAPATPDTLWQGTEDSDWFNANNWSAGVPMPSTVAGIDQGPAPLIASGTAAANDLQVGLDSVATVHQTGGSNAVTGFLYLGLNAGSHGEYLLEGGTLSADEQYVGYRSTGSVKHSGGTNTVAGSLILGKHIGSSGAYELSGAASQVTAEQIVVGSEGQGNFVQDGGTVSAGIGILVGSGPTSNATYVLESGDVTVQTLAVGNYGTGHFYQMAGQVDLGGDLSLGLSEGGDGTYALYSGGLTADGLFVGSSGAGRFVRYGGSLTLDQVFVGSLAGATFEHHAGDLSVTALEVTNCGTVDFQDGNLTVQTLDLSGTGASFVQQAGTVTAASTHVGSSLTLGRECLYSMQSGEFTAPSIDVWSDFAQSGGQSTVDVLDLQGGLYTLTGGTLTASKEVDSKAYEWTNGMNTPGLDFDGGAGTFSVTGLATLEEATVTNASSAVLNVAADSLVVFPNGFDASTEFGTVNNQGIIHQAGSTLAIAAGESVVYVGDGNSIQDRLECEGTVDASQSEGLDLDAGVSVWGNGSVDLGSGVAYATDETSAISGGQLTAAELQVGNNAGTATFTQTGGTITGSVAAGLWSSTPEDALYGLYIMQDGQIAGDADDYVWSDADSTIEQSGGSINTGVVAAGGTYEFSGGSIVAGTVWSACNSSPWYETFGTFTWTDGSLTATEKVLVEGGIFEWVTTNTMDTPELTLQDGGSLVMARNFNIDDLVNGASSLFEGGGAAVSLAAGTLEVRGVQAYQQYQTLEVNKLRITEGGSVSMYINPTVIAQEVEVRSGDWWIDCGTYDIGTLTLGPESGDNAYLVTYDGAIDVDNFTVGQGGSLEVSTSDEIVINNAFTLADGAELDGGARLRVKGGDFVNESTDDTAVAGLAALELVFEGTGNTFEVASENVWPKATPWTDDFAMETLHLVSNAEVDLADLCDNQLDGSLDNEAVYVTDLILDSGSTLNLNGLWLYYDSANSVINGTIVGNTYDHVPEPATLALLAMGGLAVICRKSRGRG